jgi:hypothetical protein
MKRIKVLIVPDWIVAPIKAMNENISVLTQPEKLLRILSKDDVAFYIRTIDGFMVYCDPSLSESIDPFSSAKSVKWDDVTAGALERSVIELGQFTNAVEYLSFIMKHGANGCVVDETRTIIGFDVLGYDYDSFMLRPKAVDRKEIYQCYEDLFAVMHKFMPTHEIASLPIFKLYENLLNNQLR